MILENDCEDQGFTKLSDGCFNWKCQTWEGNKPVRPQLIKHNGWWICPTCRGSYGAVK